MTTDWKDGYNFALKEIRSFIEFINGNSTAVINFRANNGSKGVIDEILYYLDGRKKT